METRKDTCCIICPWYELVFVSFHYYYSHIFKINQTFYINNIFFSQELLEKKVDYCEHLLSITEVVSPGPSELRAYILWELQGARLRMVQYNWIRMKITTPTYLQGLDAVQKMLYDVIKIFGPIRLKSDEGKIGLMAKQGLQEVIKIVRQLTTSNDNRTDKENSPIPIKPKRLTNRLSITDSAQILEKALSQMLTA